MINYKACPAVLTKSILEFIKKNNILALDEFDFILELDDAELVSMKMVIRLLESIETDDNNNYSYFDLFEYFSFRMLKFFNPLLSAATIPSERLSNFYHIYQGRMANEDWVLEETETYLTLVANRGAQVVSSKYEDLTLYYFIKNLINPEIHNDKDSFKVSLPFERHFYQPLLDSFENASFSNGRFSFSVKKRHQQIKYTNSIQNKNKLSVKKQVIAAANMIPIDKLDLTSLAFNLSMSKRNLQRTLQKSNLHPHEIIKIVKINHAKRKLLINGGNFKKTAYQCGYNDQSQLTRLFLNNTGVTPKEWFKQQ